MKNGINEEVLVVSSRIGKVEVNKILGKSYVLADPNSVISIRGIEKNWGPSMKKVKSYDVRPAYGMVKYNRRG